MKFDYTYILVGGFKVYEPMIILTNSIFFILCLLFYRRLSRFQHEYARQVAVFMLLLGISSIFGAIGHSVHFQLGQLFYKTVAFLMNALSLFAIYYNFKFTYTYMSLHRPQKAWLNYMVIAWVLVLLVLSLVNGDFTLIKIHAGIALLYCLVVFLNGMTKRGEKGSALIVYGILLSFLSILVHTFKLQVSIWFNHKDIAHVFMIVTLILMYRGTVLNLRRMAVPEKEAT